MLLTIFPFVVLILNCRMAGILTDIIRDWWRNHGYIIHSEFTRPHSILWIVSAFVLELASQAYTIAFVHSKTLLFYMSNSVFPLFN